MSLGTALINARKTLSDLKNENERLTKDLINAHRLARTMAIFSSSAVRALNDTRCAGDNTFDKVESALDPELSNLSFELIFKRVTAVLQILTERIRNNDTHFQELGLLAQELESARAYGEEAQMSHILATTAAFHVGVNPDETELAEYQRQEQINGTYARLIYTDADINEGLSIDAEQMSPVHRGDIISGRPTSVEIETIRGEPPVYRRVEISPQAGPSAATLYRETDNQLSSQMRDAYVERLHRESLQERQAQNTTRPNAGSDNDSDEDSDEDED